MNRDVSMVICELSGYDSSVRVRQLVVLDEPHKGYFSSITTSTVLQNYIEVETLKIFKNIASQVSNINTRAMESANKLVGVLLSLQLLDGY